MNNILHILKTVSSESANKTSAPVGRCYLKTL